MSVIKLPKWLLVVATLFSSLSALAQTDVSVFESCVDSRGRLLKAVSDPAQPILVRTAIDAEGPAIHYHPDLLPRLSPVARLFFYAHECARVGLGDPAEGRSIERVRLADCKAVDALLASGAVARRALPALQAELSFSEKEWALLPGPPRNFELGYCTSRRGNVLSLPAGAAAAVGQTQWNDCVRACADRLLACPKQSCGGAGCGDCTAHYNACQAACGSRP